MEGTATRQGRRRVLHDGWTLELTDAASDAPSGEIRIPAVVPGCVHTDLLTAGLIADPDVGTAENDQHWVGRSVWTYRTHFTWQDDGAEHVDLVCDGLDTLAELRLNGEVIARTRNMHRSYRFAVRDRLQEGDNELEVRFASIGDEVERVRAEVGELPAAYPTHYPYVRKMACNFGWDWGPKLTTAGIWRDIAIESWTAARFDQVRPLVDLDAGTGRLDVHVSVAGEAPAQVRVEVAGRQAIVGVDDGGVAHVSVTVPDVQPWWPVGLGEARLYDVAVVLLVDDAEVDRHETRVGFRTVEIAEEPDELGSRWAFVINGLRVPARGYNWIPDDVFVTEVDRARYERRIDQAVAGNANILRVWGGGIYESDDFYDVCDERGVLVWQDFLFACAAYPETDDYAAEVEAEARDAITRLATHPSLVLWNANNENTWGFHDWGWQEQLDGRPWGARYYGELFPALIDELDPTRPYLIGSPSSGSLEAAPNDDRRGVQHLWDVWNQVDLVHYRDHPASFVAEMGWCAPPTWATLRRAVPDGELSPSNPVVLHHQRAADGPEKLQRGLEPRFPGDHRPEDWHYLTQVVQARSQQVGAEHLRALARCSGVIVWQLNDCWPVMSWAAVDGDERLKPLWYALREAFLPRRITLQPDEDGLELVAIDDERESWEPLVRVRRVGFDGTVIAATDLQLSCASMEVDRASLDPSLAMPDDPTSELLVADTAGQRAVWFWREDVDLAYPRAEFETSVVPTTTGVDVTITAATLLRELSLFVDRIDVDGVPVGPEVTVDTQLVTLLPGESHTFRVRGAPAGVGEVVADRWSEFRDVVRCTNDVGTLRSR